MNDNDIAAGSEPDVCERCCRELSDMADSEGYPYDPSKDGQFIRQLQRDFPCLDLVEQIRQWRAWMLDNADGLRKEKKINYRSRFRQWCKHAKLWAGKKSGRRSGKGSGKYEFEQKQAGTGKNPVKVTDIW